MSKLVEMTIGECLEKRMLQTPDKISIVYDGKSYTWSDLYHQAVLIKQWLEYLEVKTGDRVALNGYNSYEWIAAYYAVVSIGAIAVPINFHYKDQELIQVLRQIEVQHVIFDDTKKANAFRQYQKGILPQLKTVELFGAWNVFEKEEGKLLNSENLVDSMKTANILFTSGSTSRPKGVMLSHYSLINNARSMCEHTGWSEQDRMCLTVPLFHCFGITAGILASMISGASIYICRKHTTDAALQIIETYHCTIFNGVPTMFLAIMQKKTFLNYDLSSVRSGLIAGSKVAQDDYMKIKKTLGYKKLYIAYGQTETSPCITISSGDEYDAESVGKTIPYAELRIWDSQKNMEMSVGVSGKIQTRGYHVMQGYYGMPDETQATIDMDGWLNTGDLGYLDADRNLYIIGREKEMIVRGGENIAPAEIEECISKLDGVLSVKVFGVPSPVLQEDIAACIVFEKEKELSSEMIQNYIGQYLADYKIPKYVYSIKEMPLLPNGKVDMNQLKDGGIICRQNH